MPGPAAPLIEVISGSHRRDLRRYSGEQIPGQRFRDPVNRMIGDTAEDSGHVSELNRLNMQAFLDARGDGSFYVMNHLRWDLVAILDLALSDGLIPRNQAR